MTEQEKTAARNLRRNGRNNMERIIKVINETICQATEPTLVTELQAELQTLYNQAKTQHESYIMMLNDDQAANEDHWMEECFGAYMKTKSDLQKLKSPNNENSNNNTKGDNNRSVLLMQKPSFPTFEGDIKSYPIFKADFTTLIEGHYTERNALTILRAQLKGKALEIIEGIANDYREAWHCLDRRFGDIRLISDTVNNDLRNFMPLRNYDDDRFSDLVQLLRRSYQILKLVGKQGDFDNTYAMGIIESKLCAADRREWARYLSINDIMDPDFKQLIGWLECEERCRLRANAPIRLQDNMYQRNNRTNYIRHTNLAVNNDEYFYKCWVCKSKDHWTDQCNNFRNMGYKTRLELCKNERVCYSCLKIAGKDHTADTCNRKRKCNYCNQYHHYLLHNFNHQENDNHSHSLLNHKVKPSESILPILTTTAKTHDEQETSMSTMFDSGSNVSLIREEKAKEMKLQGQDTVINIIKVGGIKETLRTKYYEVYVKACNGTEYECIRAYGIKEISTGISNVNPRRLNDIFEDKIEGKIQRNNSKLDLLIGVDHPILFSGNDVIVGGLVAKNTPLGWVVFGNNGALQNSNDFHVEHVNLMHITLEDFWRTESLGVEVKVTCGGCKCGECNEEAIKLSAEERKELNIIRTNCKKKEGESVWTASYPWKKDPNELPDNRSQAIAKLISLENRLIKSEEYSKCYDNQMKDMVNRKTARLVENAELTNYKGPVHYISHHGVEKKESESTPLRIVFNSSSKFEGHILNDYWMKGADLLNNLLGVILRFRENKIAIQGDISKMYHSIQIPELEQHVHRFLWRNMNLNKQPDTYVMQKVCFGDKPSGCIALVCLRKTAEENMDSFPNAAETIKKQSYVDDICESVNSMEEAVNTCQDINQVLSTGGFKIKKWIIAPNDENTGKGKILGVCWDTQDDSFFFETKPINLVPELLTKRIILSLISSIYDPQGLISPLVIRAKIGIQKLWSEQFDWDEKLPPNVVQFWTELFKEMESISILKFKRCLTPDNAIDHPTLILFSDASNQAFGAVAYIRWKLNDGTYEVRLIMAKSRVAPLKTLTIVKLELQAAVMAKRLASCIIQESRFEFEEILYFVDSEVVKALIDKGTTSTNTFIAVRINEIRTETNPHQWKWIESEKNIADILSRGTTADNLSKQAWLNGPEFLTMNKSEWPIEYGKKKIDISEHKTDDAITMNIVEEQTSNNCIMIEKYSSFRKLIRITAMILKAIQTKSFKGASQLETEDIYKAERYWIVEAQGILKARVLKGEYKTLDTFTDKDGIIRVGGRVDKAANISYNERHPILLPYDHKLSRLIALHHHEMHHCGNDYTVAQIRQKYWITKAGNLVKAIRRNCVTCKKLASISEKQVMAELPKERLLPSPPFWNTACDYFGPMYVRISKRRTKKVFGVIFTCLATRAIHLDVAMGYSTEEFIHVLRRFCAVRGYPSSIRSDRGRQFVGAAKFIQQAIEEWNIHHLTKFCTEKGIKWKFVTPYAPHMNGCVEALVKTTKRAIVKAIGKNNLTTMELVTVFMEIADIVNQRPIGRIPNHPSDDHYLCPNDILLGRASTIPNQTLFLENIKCYKRLEFCNKLVEHFWKRWHQDVFPTLMIRKKWQIENRNVAVGDVVVMKDLPEMKGKWKLAKVTKLFAGKDKRIRNVELIDANKRTYERAIQKICVILPNQ